MSVGRSLGRWAGGWARRCAVAVTALATVTSVAGFLPASRAALPVAALPLPTSEATSPALASPEPGRRDVFWVSGGRLKQRYVYTGGAWRRTFDRGGSLASQPAVVSWGKGRLDIFARGTDNRLKWLTWSSSGGWTSWRTVSGVLTSAPAVASWAPGRLDVFVRSSDNRLYQRTYSSGTWSGWARRGGTLTSSPAATSRATGRIDVVARTTGNDLIHRSYSTAAGWSAWRNLGGSMTAQPAIAAPTGQRLDVVTRGARAHVNVRSFVAGSGWTAAVGLGDSTYTSGPGAVAIGDDVVVAARRANGYYYEATRREPTGSWSSWRIIDGFRPFKGLATWVDVFDYAELTPSEAVADMKARGVRTLFLATARFDSARDFHDEAEMGRWLDEAHAAGINVIGWYVPAYGDMARDVRRTVAIARYVSPGGQLFDAVGVDIERFGASGEVSRTTFNARAIPHLQQVRSKVAAVFGAIVPSPFATDAGNNWEGFPWAGIGPNSDVVVPMALWSFRRNPNGTAYTTTQVHDWVVDQIDRTQALTGRRVHVEGGVDDPGTENTPVTAGRVQAFVNAVGDGGAIGGSHYDYATTRPEFWPILAGING